MARYHAIQATASEELAQGRYVAARAGVELATYRAEGIEHHQLATKRCVSWC